ncbi:MAG: hypothetical protein IID40_03880 [Planctomycetes bacterium]|nr:hypothetical protein [Planctomycetota bacterium]
MSDPVRQPNELESLLAELQECERAGVFRRTPVEVTSAVGAESGTGRSSLTHLLYVGMQLAACVGLVIGLTAVWRVGNDLSTPLANSNSSAPVALTIGEVMETLTLCINGPAGEPLSEQCRGVDFDRDQDVDLADFGEIQVAFAGAG